MTDPDEAQWAEELADLLDASLRILRWGAAALAIYIAAMILAAAGVA